jgi:small-conductance mechanosensitive channel
VTCRRSHLATLAVAAMLVAGTARAQPTEPAAATPQPAATEAPATAPVPTPPAPAAQPLDTPTLNEIGRRAEQVAGELRRMTDALGDSQAFAEIDTAVSTGTHHVGTRWSETGRLLDASPRRSALDTQRSAWQSLRTDLEDLQQTVDARDHAREADQKALVGLRESWERTLDLARSANAPATIVTRAEQTLAAIDATHAQVDARRAHTLVWEDAVSRAIQGCDDAIARIDEAEHETAARTFVQHRPPIWASDDLLADADTGEAHVLRMNESSRAGAESVRTYFQSNRVGFAVTAVLAVLLIAVVRRARASVALRSKSDATLAAAMPVFQAPHAAGLIIALMLTVPLRPNAPIAVRSLLLLLSLPALIALLRPLLDRRLRSSLYALAGLFVLELARRVLQVAPGLEQLVMVLEMGTATAVLLRAATQLRASGASHTFYSAWFGRAASGVLRLLGIGAGVGAAASTLGYLELADFAGGGSIFLAYVVFVAVGVRAALDGLLALALGAGPTSRLRAPRRHRALVERRVRWFLDVAIALLWLQQAFDRFELLVPARELVSGVLDARLHFGDLDVSLGRVLGFPVVLVGAYFLARIIVFVLEEDVYSRMALPRGVPYALSSLTRYGLLLLGFFLALGSLGFDLTRLTVLVSAFGLGIGFGLQQVVNNFVSGLILLFERPIQVGDAVQLGDMLGEVTRIGIRSSTVRTLEGAEVIVPNSNMLEEKVTNWTLSDRKRRIDLNVGVSYGTDASTVIALLQKVASENPKVVQAPAPDAFFIGFGDSSLDFQLRVWTEDPGWFGLRSQLNVALQLALQQAGIEVPFPQRDLHVRSEPPGERG